MARPDKHESEARARVVLALLASETTLAEAARELGVAEQDVLLWKELFLAGARAQLGAQRTLRPWSKRTRRLVAAGAVLSVIGLTGVAASQGVWPISLVTFTADTPAVASEVNGNFSALKTGVEQVKTWAENKVGPLDQGGLMSDYPGSAYDLWLQGSTTTSAGTDRNAALVGDTLNDKLLIDFDGEYQGGVEVQSSLNVLGGINAAYTNLSGLEIYSPTASGFQPFSVTTFPVGSSPRHMLMDDDEMLVSDGNGGVAPLYIQGNGTTTGVGGPTQLGGDVSVLGSLVVRGTLQSANRYVVTARYDNDYTASGVCTSVTQIDMTQFTNLCSDLDGCTVTIIMKDYDASLQDASIGPLHFEYDSTSRVFHASDNSPGNAELSRTIGTNGNNVTEHALRAWNCYLTDTVYTLGAGAGTDNTADMYLLNFNANTAYKPDCVMVVDD